MILAEIKRWEKFCEMIFENLDRLESSLGGDIIPQAKITYQVEVLSNFNLLIKYKLPLTDGTVIDFWNTHIKKSESHSDCDSICERSVTRSFI